MMHKMNEAKKAVNFVSRNIMLKQTMPLLFETLSQYPVVCARIMGSQLNPNLKGKYGSILSWRAACLLPIFKAFPFQGSTDFTFTIRDHVL